MNVEGAKSFIHDHGDQILDLFLTYQMIEMTLFFKLHLPRLPEVRYADDELGEINKELNAKTLGKLKNKYLEKFPNDDYDLKFDLETVAMQRNSFMHTLWVVIAMAQDQEKIARVGEIMLDNFGKGVHELLEKIHKLPA